MHKREAPSACKVSGLRHRQNIFQDGGWNLGTGTETSCEAFGLNVWQHLGHFGPSSFFFHLNKANGGQIPGKWIYFKNYLLS